MHTSDWLRARAEASPEVVALHIGEKNWRYDQLDQLVDRLCYHLAARGVSAGDVTAALLPSGLAAVCLIHALTRLGAVLVPLNGRHTSAELDWQLEYSRAKWLIGDTNTARAIAYLSLDKRAILILDNAWQNTTMPAPFTTRSCSADELQAILFTSGTTGQPKGAMITYGNHFYSAMASAYRLGLDPQDIWLSCLPLYHVGGLAVIFRCCLYGTAVDLHALFDVAAIQQSFQAKAITLISLVPTMLQRLLDAVPATRWPPSLRLILLGGAAAAPELWQRIQAGGLPLAATYGLTEAASQVATSMPPATAAKPGSVGKPLLFTRIRIADQLGQTLPRGAYGEICVRGPTVMAGYLHNPAATEAAIRDGELCTGDIGYLDEEGDLWLVQRRSDLIVSGGENVYPAEVEKVLRAHPDVAQACVVGIADQEWGQKVAAMVVPLPERDIEAAELRDYCRRSLAGYKIPKLIHFTSALPMTSSGKVHRLQVADLLAAFRPRNNP
jgi:O-succinylbenzoic acid--CoA ligase